MAGVPVTIITGYLGAGKTTLLLRIITESRMKMAVVMNEFGDTAIDGRIIEGKNVRIAELAGGCVCCSLSGEFGLAVSEIIEKAAPEWIVVETTGAAEPGALVFDIRESMPHIVLDAIITVADADALHRFANLGQTGREQIELADIILLNKTDLVSPEVLEAVRGGISKINGRAKILECVRCQIGTEALFGISSQVLGQEHRQHKPAFSQFEFVSERKLDHGALIRILESLPGGIYRAKGFARTERGDFLVNFVAGRHELEPHGCGRTELVFIGEGALGQRKAVLSSLESALRSD